MHSLTQNSMDAISFVLGIKSSYLRSTNIKDLVYRGRVLKHSKINADGDAIDEPDGTQTNGHANGDADSDNEAGTQTSTQRNDPTTAWVMAVYEDDTGEEQTWKRSITSAGASEYRLNNKVVQHKTYNDALEAENILVKARNFLVFQGDVEQIASQSEYDLTRLIEQISGSLEYKADYDRLKEEVKTTDEEQGFKLNQRRAMNSEIKQYQDQKREVENFERKQVERDQATVTHILWKLFHFQQVIEESGAEILKHQEDLKEYRRAQEKFEQRLEEAKKEQAKTTRDLSKIERGIKKREKDIEEKENSLVPIDEKLRLSSNNVTTYQTRIAEIAKTRDRQSQSVEQLKKDLTTVEKAQGRWEKEWQQTQKQQGRQLSDSDLQEYSKLRSEVSKQTATDQMQVDNLSRQLKTDEETASSLKSKLESLQEQVQRFEDDGRELKQRRDEFATQLKQTQKDVDEKKKEYTTMTSHRVRNAQLHTEKEEKLQQVLIKLSEAESGRRESEREMRAKDTVRSMKAIFPGVKGRINELCKPKQKKFESAVGIVLGKDWDSVVVDTEKTAAECIQYLKDQRIGIATFLPLDTMQVKSVNPNLKGMHRGMRLAIDAIEYESAYERVMSSVCSNAMICDDLKVAKYLCYEKGVQATAVTIDGTKIHKGGLMTGGQGRNDKQRRWDDSEVENLHQVRIKLMADLASLNPQSDRRRFQEEETVQGELTGLEQRLSYLQNEIKSLDRNMQSRKKELDFAKSQLKEIQPKYKGQAQGVENIKTKLAKFQDSVGKIEDKVFAGFCKRLSYEDIRAYEAQQGSLQEEALKKKQEFSTQVNRLQNQLNFESTRLQSTQDRINKIENEAKRDSDLISDFEEEKETIQGEIDAVIAEVEELNTKLAELQEQANEKTDKVNEQRREFQKRSKNVEDNLKAVGELEAEVQRKSAERYALWRKCRIEEIDIPLKEDSNALSTLPLNEVQGDDDPDAMDVDDEDRPAGGVVRDYGIEVDFDELDEDLQEVC
jgi:structural maintenance of chromosome 1